MTRLTNSIHHRVFIFTILLLILCGLFIYYLDNLDFYKENPTQGTIIKSYPTGHMVNVTGTVTQTYPDGFNLQENNINYTVHSAQKVNSGDAVLVIGLNKSNYNLDAKQVTVSPEWSFQFVLIRSFLAFLTLAFIFNRYWMFNRKKLVFQRRTKPNNIFNRRK